MNAALVPLKTLEAGKSRLSGLLPRDAIEGLSLAMLGDVLEALGEVDAVDERVVVTPDPAVGRAAEAAGARALVRDDPGLNASLDAATGILADQELDQLLVVLGDVAGAAGPDLEAVFDAAERLGRPSAVIAAARDGGTAALLRTPYDAIPSRFGADSAEAHRRAAEDAGVPVEVLHLPSLAIDLDRPEDLQALREGQGPARRTRALLEELERRGVAPGEAAS